MKLKGFLWSLSIAMNILLFLFIFLLIINTDGDDFKTKNQNKSKEDKSDGFFKDSLDSTISSLNFPFQEYIHSERYLNAMALNEDISALLKNPQNNIQLVEELIFITTTDSLLKSKGDDFLRNYSPDEYVQLIRWADELRYSGGIVKERDILFSSISDYWLNFIAEKLDYFSHKNHRLVFSFKFRFLKNILAERGYFISYKVSKLDKLVYNITDNHWAHLIRASWHQSSILLKTIFFLLFIFTVSAYYVLIHKIINLKKT